MVGFGILESIIARFAGKPGKTGEQTGGTGEQTGGNGKITVHLYGVSGGYNSWAMRATNNTTAVVYYSDTSSIQYKDMSMSVPAGQYTYVTLRSGEYEGLGDVKSYEVTPYTETDVTVEAFREVKIESQA